jgi:SPP1 family predicted phage head-tail adaptor
MALLAGQLNQRLTIQQTTQTQDSFNEPDDSWGTYLTRWAKIEPLSGNEELMAGADRTAVRFRITMRYDSLTSAITGKMRGLLGSTIYEFLTPAIDRDSRREAVIIEAVVRG